MDLSLLCYHAQRLIYNMHKKNPENKESNIPIILVDPNELKLAKKYIPVNDNTRENIFLLLIFSLKKNVEPTITATG